MGPARRRGVIDTNVVFEGLTRQRSASGVIVDSATVEEERFRYGKLLEELGTATHAEVQAVLDEREPGQPEAGLTPELMERLQRRIDAKRRGSQA